MNTTTKKYLISYMVKYEEIQYPYIGGQGISTEKNITGSQLLDCCPTYQRAIEIIKDNFKYLNIKQVVLLGISEVLYEEEYHGEEIK